MTKVCEGMLIDVKECDDGYEVWMQNVSTDLFDCTLNFSSSENLSLKKLDPKVKVTEPMVVTFQSRAGTKVAYVKLPIKDTSVGSCKFHYKFKGGRSLTSKKGKDDADKDKPKPKALDDVKKAKPEAEKPKPKPPVTPKVDDELAAARKKVADAKKALEDLDKQQPTRYKSSGDCIQCHQLITDKEYLSLGEKKLHKACLKNYEWDMKNKCEHCSGVLPHSYLEFGPKGAGWGVKLHDECLLPYKRVTRPHCSTCGKTILDDKRLESKGMHYHVDCAPK